jgi:type I restriction enzyme S subunit
MCDTFKQISKPDIANFEIPLPPLPEQKRIAAILDQADELRRKRQRAIDRLNQLGRAIFYEMFGDGSRFPAEMLKTLGKVSTCATPPSSKEGSFGGPVPFVTPGDLGSDEPVKRWVTEAGAELSRTVVAQATLVCCIGATIGKMDRARERSAFNQQINAVEWGPSIAPIYGFYAVQQIRHIIIHKGKGASTTLPILKKSEFEKLAISCPPFALQDRFAERIAAVENQEKMLSTALLNIDALFASLQHRAFQGEL